MEGELQVVWARGLLAKGMLSARNLDPGHIAPGWYGKINADVNGVLEWAEKGLQEAGVRANLLDSSLQDKPLNGVVEASLHGGMFHIARLDLHGRGFDLRAQGEVQERLTWDLTVTDMAGLLPNAQGRVEANGWARWRDHRLAGSFKGRGQDLAVGKAHVGDADLEGRFDPDKSHPFEFKANSRRLTYGLLQMDSAVVEASGDLSQHSVSLGVHWPEG
jgi:translocation and assembly module TamB